MLRGRHAKQKANLQSTTSISGEYHLVNIPMPSITNKAHIKKESHHRSPIERMISSHINTSIESLSIKEKAKDIKKINKEASHSNSKIKKGAFNTLLSHNAKHQNLHFLLIVLLLFCVFLIISLCTPDIIGIDHSFQEIYYPPVYHDNFIFVYGPLINKEYKLRDLVSYTPKSQRTNAYILHDHFGSELIDQERKSDNSDNSENRNDHIVKDTEEEESLREFPVRIHHLRRGFYFDSSFNGMDNEQIVKYKTNTNNMRQKQTLNRSYTALGAQFDESYDATVNGLLLRIDEDALIEFDKHGFGAAFRRETIPLQWIDFLYSKPKEFAKNMELEQELETEKLNTMKKEKGNSYKNVARGNETEGVQKKDIDDANSMIQQDVDIEIEEGEDHEIQLIENGINGANANKDKNKPNELNVMNEENTKKYQLNVWSYIVPKEIMIEDENAQFHRIMKQSYIDVVLSGCLDIGGSQFAEEFVQSTFGWTPFMIWNDDRGQSQIFENEEKMITQYHHTKIDALLDKYVFGS